MPDPAATGGAVDTPRYQPTPRWSTGSRIFLILSVALLPLALIAIFATLRITQITDTELRSHLRVAANESSRTLAIELVGDMTALRTAMEQLDADPRNTPACARIRGVFAQQMAAGARFAVFGRSSGMLCGDSFAGAAAFARDAAGPRIEAAVDGDRGLMLRIAAHGGKTSAAAFFPRRFLAQLSQPSGFAADYGAALTLDGERLELMTLDRRAVFERRETTRTALGLDALVLDMQVRSAPIGSPLLIALALPLMMWALAATVAWLVVDRQLLAPLQRLRASIAAYTPGDEPDPSAWRGLPASEIRDLGDTFRALSRTVTIHEAGLAEGLVRQTKLTREVHHRVKNNLQVISSLINFHARSARSAEASQAYASIQRRVDALAVVHRYHFAEMEENRGVALRAVLGELASNIRATAPDGVRMTIVVDVDGFYASQDVAVAIAFLVTELIELAFTCDPRAPIRISLKPVTQGAADASDRALLRVSSHALIESDTLRDGLNQRYGRVIDGLTRQLRTTLQHDPLTGAYEIPVAVLGHE